MWVQDIGTSSCKVEVALETDVIEARAMRYLLRKVAFREWNQPKKKNCIAVNRTERSWTSDMGMQSLEFAEPLFLSGYGPVFHHFDLLGW